MRRTTHAILTHTASVIALHGLHRGEQFAQRHPVLRLDICATVYASAEWIYPWINPESAPETPAVFFTDEAASVDLIEASEDAMAAIRAISAELDTDVCETNGRPDYIEHVSTWAMTPPIGCTQPPSTDEVIGRILRAAHHARTNAA